MLLTAALIGLGLIAYGCSSTPPLASEVAEPPEQTPAAEAIPAAVDDRDYSAFKHTSEAHAQVSCLLCHTRNDNSAAPKRAGHTACAGCHVQQFAGNTSQMCSICHTDAVAGTTKPFPPLKSFNVKFDHGRHLRQTNCATCHKPMRAGIALSMPTGTAAHSTCYQCHTPGSQSGDSDISSCSVCHEPGRPVRAPTSAKAFRFKFSHRSHARNNCSTCHTVQAGNARGRQVTSPITAMHFASGRGQSCATCHNDKRAFGDDNFANCKQCHEGSSFNF